MATIKDLIAQLNKDTGEDIITIGATVPDPPRIPSGVFSIDLALSGGVPVGRLTVLYGTESSMKTTFSLKLLANAQKQFPDKRCVFVDLEGTFSSSWARSLGVDTESLAYVVPQNAEQAVDVIEALMYADDVSMIVVDSLAAMVTQRELDSSSDKALVGVQGILINKLYRKVTRALNTAHTHGRIPTLVFINQIRYKVGVMYGDPETMQGGPSFKFAASLMLRFTAKDEMDKAIHPTLPVFKKISVVVKKWKVPVVSKTAEAHIATVPNQKLGLNVGDSYDMATIFHYLKKFEFLSKNKNVYTLCSSDGDILAEAKTKGAIETQIAHEPTIKAAVMNSIITAITAQGVEV